MGDDNVALLRTIDFFAGCTPHQLDEIGKLAQDRDVPAGAEICRQGEFEADVFVIVDGTATALVDGREVNTMGAGEVVGELAMLGSGRRTATMVARTPVRLLVLDAREVDSVLAADPSSAQRLGPRTRPDA
jgi:CRP/FNR family transcriptional regulator, cyclic AMP receptor protein